MSSPPPSLPLRPAELAVGMHVVVEQFHALAYAIAQPDESRLPKVVRAGSALRRWNGSLIVIQDDVNALVSLDAAGAGTPLLLPAGEGGARSFDGALKKLKLDLESAVVLPDGRLLAFGSGSTPARERIAVASTVASLALRDAREWYASIRAALPGMSLNLEGAVVVGKGPQTSLGGSNPSTDGTQVLRMFQRGTAVDLASASAANASVDFPLPAFVAWLDGVGPLPEAGHAVAYGLGAHEGVALGITDAAVVPEGDGRIAYLACAESTADPTLDGEVVATRFGFMEADGRVSIAPVVMKDGSACKFKFEGLEPVPGESGLWNAVTDADDPAAPALLARLRVVYE